MNKYKKSLFNLLDRAIEARDGKSILKPHEKVETAKETTNTLIEACNKAALYDELFEIYQDLKVKLDFKKVREALVSLEDLICDLSSELASTYSDSLHARNEGYSEYIDILSSFIDIFEEQFGGDINE